MRVRNPLSRKRGFSASVVSDGRRVRIYLGKSPSGLLAEAQRELQRFAEEVNRRRVMAAESGCNALDAWILVLDEYAKVIFDAALSAAGYSLGTNNRWVRRPTCIRPEFRFYQEIPATLAESAGAMRSIHFADLLGSILRAEPVATPIVPRAIAEFQAQRHRFGAREEAQQIAIVRMFGRLPEVWEEGSYTGLAAIANMAAMVAAMRNTEYAAELTRAATIAHEHLAHDHIPNEMTSPLECLLVLRIVAGVLWSDQAAELLRFTVRDYPESAVRRFQKRLERANVFASKAPRLLANLRRLETKEWRERTIPYSWDR